MHEMSKADAIAALIAAAAALNQAVIDATVAGLHVHLKVDELRTRSVSSDGVVEYYPGVVPACYEEVQHPALAGANRR